MVKYLISFENFMSNEKKTEKIVSSPEEVLEEYKSINWFNLLTKVTPKNQNDSDIVDDNSWNFSVTLKNHKREDILHIHPHIYPSTRVQPDEIKLVVEFMACKIVPTSKFSQFFGGSKEKAVEENKTAAIGVLQADVLTHLTNFLDNNHIDLHKLNSPSLQTIIEESGKVY